MTAVVNPSEEGFFNNPVGAGRPERILPNAMLYGWLSAVRFAASKMPAPALPKGRGTG